MTRPGGLSYGIRARRAAGEALDGPSAAEGAISGTVAVTGGYFDVRCHQGALSITVPLPPSTNALYATVNGRRVKTRTAREYTEVVRQRVWLWEKLGGVKPRGPYRLTILLYPASNRRLDVSNSVKCLEDAVFAALQQNDKAVHELVVRLQGKDPLDPRAEVTLGHLEA